MRRAALLWLVFLAAYATTAGQPLNAPEAHALLTARSLVDDGDFDLRNQYRERAWRPFYDHGLAPAADVGPSGRLLEPQGLLFPALIAPAYAVGGAVGVELFLAALAALAFVLAAALARRLVPEPWATRAALVTGLSPPAIGAATAISPEATAAAALAGAAILALRVREEPRLRWTFWCAALLALTPWLAVKFLVPAAVVAGGLARWLRRRHRGLAGFTALELVLCSAVVYVTVNDRLFGGRTPYAARLPGDPGPTGAGGVWEHLARAPRLVTLLVDPHAGLLVVAPFGALAFLALFLLWRSRRERLALAVREQVDVEVTAGFFALVCAAQLAVAAFLAPALRGPWFPGHELVVALPFGAALAAWGLRRAPRAGTVLAALTLVASLWLVAGVLLGGARLAPPSGPLPWGLLDS
jgi:hypothetical protein